MKNPNKEKAITFTVPPEMIEEVTRIAKKRKMPKAQVYKMMIDLGISCHRDMERAGLIAAVDFVYYVKKSVKERISTHGKKQLSLI